MPLFRLQSEILRTLAKQRNPESYVAGSTPLHRDGSRFSGDIGIAHHREEQPLVPNAETIDAMLEARAGGLPRFRTTADLLKDLNAGD